VFGGTTKLPRPDFLLAGFTKGWDTSNNKKILRRYNCRDSIATIRIWNELKIDSNSREFLAYQWVSDNLKCLVKARHSGIYLNQRAVARLECKMSIELGKTEVKLRRTPVMVYDKPKRKYKIDANKLNVHLYKTLDLPVLKRTPKTKMPSTDADTLEDLESKDRTGFVSTLLKYKKYSKIVGNYCKNLRDWGDLAHPRIFPARMSGKGTNTGRVTWESFINLPARDKSVKKCLTSRYGKEGIIVAMDFSQIEMRILADLSKDEAMMRAFEEDLDLHTYTASQIRGIPMEEVDEDQRFLAKATNFGIVYGQTPAGLANTAKISVIKATKFIQMYFKKFPGVKSFIETMRTKAIHDKIIYSPLGRPYHLPNARNEYSKDCRKAVNSPIQGAAGDFCIETIKQCQLSIDYNNWRAHIELAVYDSIVMDWLEEDWERTPKGWCDRTFIDKPIKTMRTLGWFIEVPIKYDLGIGRSWGDIN